MTLNDDQFRQELMRDLLGDNLNLRNLLAWVKMMPSTWCLEKQSP